MSANMPHGQAVKRLNLVAESQGNLYDLAEVSFSKGDASIYVRPRGIAGTFHYGLVTVPAGVQTLDVDLVGQHHCEAPTRVKFSLHESGQAHVKHDKYSPRPPGGVPVAGPLEMGRLVDMRDFHIATLTLPSIQLLPACGRALKTTGDVVDYLFPFNASDQGVITLWVNAFEPAGTDEREWFEIDRESLERPLYLGITRKARPMHIEEGTKGLVMIAGWDGKATDPDAAVDFIYLRQI